MPEVLLQLPHRPRRKDPALDPKPPLTEFQLQDHLASGSPAPPTSSSPTLELQHRRTPGARHGRRAWSFDAAGHQGPDLDRPRRLRPGPSTQDMPLSSLSSSLLLFLFLSEFSLRHAFFWLQQTPWTPAAPPWTSSGAPIRAAARRNRTEGSRRRPWSSPIQTTPRPLVRGNGVPMTGSVKTPTLPHVFSPWPTPSLLPRCVEVPACLKFSSFLDPFCHVDVICCRLSFQSRAPYVAQWLSPLVFCWATRDQIPVAAIFFFSSNLLLQRSSSWCYLRYDRMHIMNTKTQPDRPVDPALLQHGGQRSVCEDSFDYVGSSSSWVRSSSKRDLRYR